jgi:hypothetical protein
VELKTPDMLHLIRACSTPAAEARLLRHRRPLLGVVRGHHRVVRRQVPFRTVIFRHHGVRRQVRPFQHRHFHAFFETHQMVGKHRASNINRWHLRVTCGR